MNAPYREMARVEDDEPIPNLGVDRRLWPGLLRHTALVLTAALVLAVFDEAEAIKLLVVSGPGVVIGAIFAVLREPVGDWLERRHARAVIEGVAALEAKASARE